MTAPYESGKGSALWRNGIGSGAGGVSEEQAVFYSLTQAVVTQLFIL